MAPWLLLLAYCLAIVLASLVGGLVPMLVRLTHRRLEIALSFVSGVMLGIALLHLLPHAIMEQRAAGTTAGHGAIEPVALWLLAGLLTMFVLERFFTFHHHEAPPDQGRDSGRDSGQHQGQGEGDGHGTCGHDHHRLSWTGAAVGLTLHTLIAGMALAASVESEWTDGAGLAGLGTFLVIVLHKPFDSLTIGTLMAAGRHRPGFRHLVNGLFALAVPVGAGLFLAGLAAASGPGHATLAAALAFSAGTFLCIALSDLLPELHFHRHDRVPLTLALLAGLALAWGVARLESAGHDHDHEHHHDHPATVAREH